MRVVDAKAGETELGEPDVIVDALFGTGFSGEPRADAVELIELINASDAEVVAVDLPSGVDASTGEVAGVAVEATCTVAFHGEKVGQRGRARRVSRGSYVDVADIGLEPLETRHQKVVGIDILQLVPRRIAARQQVHGRLRARRRRLARDDGRAALGGASGVPGRRGLRRRRDTRRVASRCSRPSSSRP